MSNPGVINLSSLSNLGPNCARLDIEDNIGEAIHIHWNNIRLDFTINEFLQFADELSSAQKSLDKIRDKNLRLDEIDPLFLIQMTDLLSDITYIEYKKTRLSRLKILVNKRFGIFGHYHMPTKIEDGPAASYLKSKAFSNKKIRIINECFSANNSSQRILRLKKSIETNGYPYNGGYITLFGDQNYIRDGQHRATVLQSMHGPEHEILVRVIHFRGNTWKEFPYRKIFISLLKRIRNFIHTKIKAIACINVRKKALPIN